MGTASQAVKVQQIHQAQTHNSSAGMMPEPSAGAVPDSAGQSAQYWYKRVHRALKQRASESAQMIREYQHVCALDYNITHSTSVAKSRVAAGRNRYTNVLPFDFNRVVLPSEAVPYLNASHVSVQLPTLPHPCSYIATQGPLPATTADFWRMVFELQVPAIVMLTNVAEAGGVKCAQYFPQHLNSTSRMPGLELKIEQQARFSNDCTLRTMQLCCSASGNSHTVSHYHFHAWPDHGTPDSSSGIRALCKALRPAHASGRPIVVHCSAGIGRTGTFCAIDILLQRLDAWTHCCGGSGPDRPEVEAALDVPALVHSLRTQRMGMVQTLEQYVFVYKALLDDLAARNKAGSSAHTSSSTAGAADNAGSSGSTSGGSSDSSSGRGSPSDRQLDDDAAARRRRQQ